MPRKKKDDAAYIADMLDAARLVLSATESHTFETFRNDRVVRYAAHRGIEIIGEAAKHVSDEMKSSQPEIPWSKIVRQRHRLAHDYDDIDDELIWTVIRRHIPVLIEQLESLLPPPPSTP